MVAYAQAFDTSPVALAKLPNAASQVERWKDRKKTKAMLAGL